jgi:rare lipoprotein A
MLGIKILLVATTATFYADWFSGKPMANGRLFNQSNLTCASNQFPLGTKLKVKNKKNGRVVFVQVTDRCVANTNVDLSKAAFSKIASLADGLIHVVVIPQ